MERAPGFPQAIHDIQRSHVRLLQEYLLSIDIRPTTINKICSVIRAALQRMVDDEILSLNPFARFRPLHGGDPGPAHLDDNQLAKFIQAVNKSDNEYFRRIIRIILLTGIRRTEAMSICREDVDLEGRRMLVMNVKRRDRRKRWITIPAAALDDIRWMLDTTADISDPAMPFARCHKDTLSRWTHEVIQAAGLPASLHLHSLRHTWVTRALAGGESPWRVRDHLDHSDIRITDGYAHTDVDDGREIDVGIDWDDDSEEKPGKR